MGSRVFILTTIIRATILTCLILAGQSCSDVDDCFTANGDDEQEYRQPGVFDRIYLTDNIDLRIHRSPTHRLTLNGGKNLLPQVETRIENGTLRILNNNRCNWTRSFKKRITIDIYTPALNGIYVEDAIGNITTPDTIYAGEFRLDSFSSMGTYDLILNCTTATLALHNGAADLRVSGTTQVQYGYTAGYGNFDAGTLKTSFAFITNKGTNRLTVNPVNLLDARIEGAGDIYYRGQPDSIYSQITGTGKLINL